MEVFTARPGERPQAKEEAMGAGSKHMQRECAASSAIKGKGAIESLVKRFPQLYVAPAEGARDAHRTAATMGIPPENANLEHFSVLVPFFHDMLNDRKRAADSV